VELNDPRFYHRTELSTLGWELTVCNALSTPESPCFKALTCNQSYGSLLFDFISAEAQKPRSFLEIGGGYGFLARDFLKQDPSIQATGWDISPALIKVQVKTLKGFRAVIEERDILSVDPDDLKAFDLVLMNEMIGDLPALIDVTDEELNKAVSTGDDFFVREAKRVAKTYPLSLPPGPFNLNIGAILALEKILTAGVKTIFIAEHSCEAVVPEDLKTLISVSSPGVPEEIPLRGHKEYTIKFSHLEALAQAFSYRVKRGPIADFIPLKMSERLRICLRAPTARTAEEEIIRQFVSDLYQYEYLLLTKGARS